VSLADDLCTILHPNFGESTFRDCPKSLVGARGVALWTTGKALFDPFRLPHEIRIHLRNLLSAFSDSFKELDFSHLAV
jgi:hypothetical protein